jgi:hypothetical protein
VTADYNPTKSRCTATHSFSDEPLGSVRQCSLNAGHADAHLTADNRWWSTYSQPAPKPNDGPAIADLVMADIKARDQLGQQRYGTRLQANNGRDALVDAYQEALDLAFYLRQAIEERGR